MHGRGCGRAYYGLSMAYYSPSTVTHPDIASFGTSKFTRHLGRRFFDPLQLEQLTLSGRRLTLTFNISSSLDSDAV